MGKRGQPEKVSHDQIAEALRKSGGMITRAAELLHVDTSTISKRVSRSPKLQEIRTKVKMDTIEILESVLIEKAKGGDLGAICFYLKCQGKDQGWVERQEMKHDVGGQSVLVAPGINKGKEKDKDKAKPTTKG